MDKWWSPQTLLLLLIARDVFSREVCSKMPINSCNDCIRSTYCVWCKQLNFTTPGEQESARCDTKAELMKKGCMEGEIISPQNSFNFVENKPLGNKSEPVQLQPQAVKLQLRPGLPHTFQITFSRIEGYPVDLYYLMDLSNSMSDDLLQVKRLGQELFDALQEITGDAQIGFGSFVDKTVLPYTNTNKEKLKHPCKQNEPCQHAFGYRHVVSMTNDSRKFNSEVGKQEISGNLDIPEGSLDAVMQAAVCGDRIGWRINSTRLIVLTTDAGFHMAGDGKLAGILEPNDENCWLENQEYSKSNVLDYPSVGQVARQLEKNNIQPIFAVTNEVELVYKNLSKLIPKSQVGVLDKDSKNVVQLIETAYNKLSSEVTVTHSNLSDNVKVTYIPHCSGAVPQVDSERGVCENVTVGEKISFSVTVTATKCMTHETSFFISPLGIKDKLKVTVSTRCECECDDSLDKSPYCSGNGTVSCGMCSCHAGFVGQRCECAIGNKDTNLRARCIRNNGTECEGRGDCVCGVCQCRTMEGGGTYYGEFCECDNKQCVKHKNELCAGNGLCECGTCKCFPGYQGNACECKESNEQCRTHGSVCSGRGNCTCNRCDCLEGFQPPFCRECHGCASLCQTKGNCIECLGFGTGPFSKSCPVACKGIQHKMVERLRGNNICTVRDVDNCKVSFLIERQDGEHNYTAQILQTRECPELPNIYAIIGGSIAGVALIGILILLLIKGLIHMNDLKEFRKFQNDQKNSQWAKVDNPLFEKATTTVDNPTFTGI